MEPEGCLTSDPTLKPTTVRWLVTGNRSSVDVCPSRLAVQAESSLGDSRRFESYGGYRTVWGVTALVELPPDYQHNEASVHAYRASGPGNAKWRGRLPVLQTRGSPP